MSRLMNCGVCCMLLSVWGIIQLALMGSLFYVESPTVFEECEPQEYRDYDDFIEKTKANYYSVAVNCWIASGAYFVTFLISIGCIMFAKRSAKKQSLLIADSEYICSQDPISTEKKKKVANVKLSNVQVLNVKK